MKIRGIVPAIPHPRALKVLLLIGDVSLCLRCPRRVMSGIMFDPIRFYVFYQPCTKDC
nr:MAG TPA: hypothetical protein [Caudoviricetes sp.]